MQADPLSGFTHPDFASVRPVLARQIRRRGGGGSLTVVHRGEVVVDLWGGVRDANGAPWTRDTVALSFSTTKGVTSTLVHILASQGRIDYGAPVARYWPAFAQGGKRDVTVRHLLAHQAGLWAIRDLVDDAAAMRDWSGMLERLERARPLHPANGRSGYHAFTYGWLIGGLVEHVTGKPFARALEDELAGPLGLDGCFIGLPAAALDRRATLLGLRANLPEAKRTTLGQRLVRGAIRFAYALALHDANNLLRALAPRGITDFDWNAAETVQACMPAASGMFTSHALARMYAMIAEGGRLGSARLLSQRVITEAARVQSRRPDDVLLFPFHWRLGYHRASYLRPHAFGHFGYGGSGGWCDPSRRLAVAMTVNTGAGSPVGDARLTYLNHVIERAVARRAKL